MPTKRNKKKVVKGNKKAQSMGQLERSRILSQGNELLRLGQTSSFATNKQAPYRFLQSLRQRGELDQVSISVRDVGSRVVLTPGVYARGPGLTPSLEGVPPDQGAGAAVISETSTSEAQWRQGLCPAHAAVMDALDTSGVSRMLDVRPTYVCPVQTCHFHCYSRLELLEHFRNEHVTKKSLLQSVTATTAAVEGSISKLSTDSLKTLLGMTELPPPEPLSELLEQEEGSAMDEYDPQRPSIESSLQLAEDDDGTVVVKLEPPPDGVKGGSSEDKPFVEFLTWLFSDWSMGEDGEEPPTDNTKIDNEDEFERWIGCNHRLIYHYDHYVTARENIFLPCTIRGVRLMKDGQKVSMVVPEVMRPMKPKHVKSTASWKLHKEHPEVTLESHNDDVVGEDCFTFKCAKFKSYQGTGKMARSPPVVIGGVPWRLMVYPDGNSAQDQGEYTSVFLEVDKSHDSAQNSCWQCFVHFKLDILSSKLRFTYEKKAAHRFTSASMNWGFGQLMALPDVLDPAKGYIASDGSVSFRATVRVVAGTDIEQWGGHTTYDSISKTGMPGLPYWDGVDSPSCLRSLLQVLFYIPRVRKAVFGMQISPDDPMARPLVGLQLVFYWLHMVNDPNCSKERKEALKQAGSQLKEIMQGCSGWDALKQFPGWEPVTQSDLRLLIQVLLSSVDEQLKGTEDEGLMAQLFRGTKRAFVKVSDVEEESWEVEGFCNIELNVKEAPEGTKDLMTAFRELSEPSVPIKYMTKDNGYQTADARVLFQKLPPILMIQLVRFEEHAGQDGEKIKDRCEFPEHINLDEFLEERGETPADYTLHAMLVHYDSKDQTSRSLYHGQHAAFIRPGPVQGDWYKFMDPFVKKAAATEDVLEEAFGESGEFCGQAYMLVYMRDEWAGDLLRQVEEIPEANLDRLPQLLEKSPWSNDHNPGSDMLDDDWMEVEIVRQPDIYNYNSVDICTFKETPVGTLFKVQKLNTVKALSLAVKERFELSSLPRLFQFIHRQNGSYRPDEYLETANPLGDKQIIECASSCSKFSQSKERWHLFMLDESMSMDIERPIDKYFLLFFKLYNPVGGRTANGEPCPSLEHIGHTLAAYNDTIEKLLPTVKELVGDGTLNDAELDVFEEVSNTLVEEVTVTKTCRQQELQNGDILVVCKQGLHDVRDIDVFYAMLRNQVSVEFRELSAPHDHGFILSLEKTLSYNEVSAAVADHLELDDPMRLQFTSFAVPHDGVGSPGRTIPPPSANQTLDDMRQFASRTFPCLSHKKSSQTLLYEVLDIPVTARLLQLTRERDNWLTHNPPDKAIPLNPYDTFAPEDRESIRDLLKDMRQLAEAIRKDVRERIADLDRESTNLRTRNRSLQQDLDFVKKQLAQLDEHELVSTNKRNKDVRKRLQAAREQRDHEEQAKGTRSQFEKDIAGLLHNYMCQVSQMVAKEPRKMFLGQLEQDFTVVIGKIWGLLWRGGLSRMKLRELVNDEAFAKYFEWQAEQMLHHAKMVKRKVADRVRIFLRVCYRARVDPLSQGIKAVFRYHLCGKAVQDMEDRQRNEQLKMDAEVDMVQRELLLMEEAEKASKQAAVERERQKSEERAAKEKRRREEELRRAQEEEKVAREAEIQRKKTEEEEIARREEELRRRRIAEQEKQRQEEERRAQVLAAARKEEEARKKAELKKKKEQERAQRKKEEEQQRRQAEEERVRREKESRIAEAAVAKEAAEREAQAAKVQQKENKRRNKQQQQQQEQQRQEQQEKQQVQPKSQSQTKSVSQQETEQTTQPPHQQIVQQQQLPQQQFQPPRQHLDQPLQQHKASPSLSSVRTLGASQMNVPPQSEPSMSNGGIHSHHAASRLDNIVDQNPDRGMWDADMGRHRSSGLSLPTGSSVSVDPEAVEFFPQPQHQVPLRTAQPAGLAPSQHQSQSQAPQPQQLHISTQSHIPIRQPQQQVRSSRQPMTMQQLNMGVSPIRVGNIVRSHPVSPGHTIAGGMMVDGSIENPGLDSNGMWSYKDQMIHHRDYEHQQQDRYWAAQQQQQQQQQQQHHQQQQQRLQQQQHRQQLQHPPHPPHPQHQHQQPQLHAHHIQPHRDRQAYPLQRAPTSSVPAHDDEELAMWQAIEESQRMGLRQQGYNIAPAEPLRGRHISQPSMISSHASHGMVAQPPQVQQPQSQSQSQQSIPMTGVVGHSLQPASVNDYAVGGLPQKKFDPYPHQQIQLAPEPDFGAALPIGLLEDDNEGGDIWSAMRVEEQLYQNQLETTDVNSSSYRNNIW